MSFLSNSRIERLDHFLTLFFGVGAAAALTIGIALAASAQGAAVDFAEEHPSCIKIDGGGCSGDVCPPTSIQCFPRRPDCSAICKELATLIKAWDEASLYIFEGLGVFVLLVALMVIKPYLLKWALQNATPQATEATPLFVGARAQTSINNHTPSVEDQP